MSIEFSESTSSSLLRRASGYDGTAWLRMSQIYIPFVYRWCRQSGLQSHDIDDVVQEVFRSVAAGIGGYLHAPQGRFRGWLWGITKNKLGDHFRRIGKGVQPVGGDTGYDLLNKLEASNSNSASQSGVDDNCLIVQKTLELLKAELEPTTWQAFWRTTVGDERAADIAAELGMTKKAVRQAKYRVLRRLRAELELQLEPDP